MDQKSLFSKKVFKVFRVDKNVTKYSRMDQVKFMKENLKKTKRYGVFEDCITSNLLKVALYELYLVNVPNVSIT